MKKFLRRAIVLIPTIIVVALLAHNAYLVKVNETTTYPTNVQCFQTVVENPQCDGPRAVVFNPKTKSASVVKGTCGNEVATRVGKVGWDDLHPARAVIFVLTVVVAAAVALIFVAFGFIVGLFVPIETAWKWAFKNPGELTYWHLLKKAWNIHGN